LSSSGLMFTLATVMTSPFWGSILRRWPDGYCRVDCLDVTGEDRARRRGSRAVTVPFD